MYSNPLDTGSKLTTHRTFIRRSYVHSLCRVPTGNRPSKYIETNRILPKKECIWQYYDITSESILKHTRCKICLKLTIKAPGHCQWCYSGIFIVNFEHVLHLVLMFLVLNLKRSMLARSWKWRISRKTFFCRFSENRQNNSFLEDLCKTTLLLLHFYLDFFLLKQFGQNQKLNGALVICKHALWNCSVGQSVLSQTIIGSKHGCWQ